jgi:prepilin-type N-terminal cleavage/methylation domain-containing protein
MITNERKGFTLIEILIVVAIIAILASIVLVGLGPTQALGRDSRRLSDLQEIQNGLELYYNKSGAYPVLTTGGAWSTFQTALTGAGIGITTVPEDPSTANGRNYVYAWSTGGTSYLLMAYLESNTGSEWSGYSAPAASTFTAAGTTALVTTANSDALDCKGTGDATAGYYEYCLTL